MVESKEGDCKLEDCTEELRMQEGCKEVGHKPEERKPEVEHTQTTSTWNRRFIQVAPKNKRQKAKKEKSLVSIANVQ